LSRQQGRHVAFARLLSSAIVSQALLSAASLAVGLILIRSSTAVQFGSYMLALNAILLLVALQNALFNPPLAIHLNLLDLAGRADLVGGLYRAQQRLLPIVAGTGILVTAALWIGGVLGAGTVPLVIASILAALAILRREYFRMALLAHRRPHDVLRGDALHVGLLVAGVSAAAMTPAPAALAVLAMGVAAVASGRLLSVRLQRHEPWNRSAPHGILRQSGTLAAWSTGGAAVHWLFSQGFIYLVAATLDVVAVASIGTTRLLMMPVNLLSVGIGSLMLPLASAWLSRHGAPLLWRRLCLFAAAMAATTFGYFLLVWLARDWLFATVLRKQFAQRDELLLLWGAVFLAMVIRDQLIYLLAAQGRFRALTSLTSVGAAVSLGVGYFAMLRFGVAGALMGLLVGEVISVLGILVLSVRSAQRATAVAA
jgi:O-antigen/teichoic acid export membrane protein